MPRWVIFEAIFLSSCGYALWRGGGPERVSSAAMLIAATATIFVRSRAPTEFQQLQVGLLTIDCCLLALMLGLAFASERFWPLWMSAMAGITVLVHTSVMLKIDLVPWAYWQSEALWSYPMQILLAIATWRHRERLKRFGVDPSWRRFSAR